MFTVNPKSRYRFRIINTGAFADFKFSIDNHELEVLQPEHVFLTSDD
jgi:Multicopper oxidase